MKKLLFLTSVLFLAAFLLPQRTFSRHPYNVVLITVDTLRSDHLSCYNAETEPTPGMDTIAREGVRFTNARTLIPITTPAHLSIMSSRRPHEVNIFDNGQFFDPKTPLLSEILARDGYRTAAFVSLGVLRSIFGLNKGFEVYEDNFQENHRWYMLASEINNKVLPWLEKNRNEKFFAWIHYSDPHEPYITVEDPPDTQVWINGKLVRTLCLARQERTEFQFDAITGETLIEFRALTEMAKRVTVINRIFLRPEQEPMEVIFSEDWRPLRLGGGGQGKLFKHGYASIKLRHNFPRPIPTVIGFEGRVLQTAPIIRKNYAAEVLYTDRHIAELWSKLQELGVRNRTIVILTADHGESLGEHKRIGHLFPLWKQIIDVPLIIYYPGTGWKGKQVSDIVTHLDITPTILDLINSKPLSSMQGRSLKSFLSWAPVDWFTIPGTATRRSLTYTFAPQGKSNMYALEQNDWKLITRNDSNHWEWEAYNVKEDPKEEVNLGDDPAFFQDSDISSLRSILEDYRKESEAAYSKRTAPKLKEDEIEMLRSLGYVAN